MNLFSSSEINQIIKTIPKDQQDSAKDFLKDINNKSGQILPYVNSKLNENIRHVIENYVDKKDLKLKLDSYIQKKNIDLDNILKKISSDPVLKIKVNDLFNKYYDQQKVQENLKNFYGQASSLITEGTNKISSLLSEFGITVSSNQKSPSVKLNISTLSSRKGIKPFLDHNIGNRPITVESVVKVLQNSGINSLNINQKNIEGLKDKNLFTKVDAFNNIVGRKVIDPAKDTEDAINLFVSALTENYDQSPLSKQIQLGKSSLEFNKGPTLRFGKVDVYPVKISLGYGPLNGAGVNLESSGTVVKFNLSNENKMSNGFSISSDFSFGAAFLNNKVSWNLGGYSEKIKSMSAVVPILSSRVSINYVKGDASLSAGVGFSPGVNVSQQGNKFEFSPKVNPEIFTSFTLRI